MNSNSDGQKSGAGAKAAPAVVGSIILIFSFFLPWIRFLGQPVAGYELYKLWDPGLCAWGAPILAVCVLALAMFGTAKTVPAMRFIAEMAGAVPVLLLTYGVIRFGTDLLKGIEFGGYAEVISGAFLAFVTPRLSRKARHSVGHDIEATRDEAEITR